MKQTPQMWVPGRLVVLIGPCAKDRESIDWGSGSPASAVSSSRTNKRVVD